MYTGIRRDSDELYDEHIVNLVPVLLLFRLSIAKNDNSTSHDMIVDGLQPDQAYLLM